MTQYLNLKGNGYEDSILI